MSRVATGAWQRACRLLGVLPLVAVLGVAGPVGADPPPPAEELGADAPTLAFLARLAAGEEDSAIRAFVTDDGDPWIAGEVLRLLGRQATALDLADANLTSDAPALRSYLEREEALPRDLARSVARAQGLLAERQPEEALSAIPQAVGGHLTVTEIRALGLRAEALAQVGRSAEAAETLERVAARAAALGWRRAESDAQTRLLAGVGPEGDPGLTRRVLARLLAIDQDTRDAARSAEWASRLGRLEARHGNARVARMHLLEAESLFAALASGAGLPARLAEERARAIQGLAELEFRLGLVAQGLGTALRAYDLSRESSGEVRMNAARTLSYGYQQLARWKEALQYAEEAVRLAKGQPAQAEVRLLGDMARIYVDMGDSEGADALYRQVFAAEAIRTTPRLRFVARLHAAAAWIDRPQDERRPELLQRALLDLLETLTELAREPAGFEAKGEIEANAKALAARALNLLGRPSEAEPLLRSASVGSYAHDVPAFEQYLKRELACCLRLQGRPAEGLAAAKDALSELAAVIDSLPSSFGMGLLAQPGCSDLVEERLAAALDLGSAAEVRLALEATRAMAFRSEVARRQRRADRPLAPLGSVNLAVLAERVAQAAEEYGAARSAGALEGLRAARARLWQDRLRLRAAEERLGLEETAALTGVDPGPLEEGPSPPPALESDEAMLYFAFATGRAFALLHAAGHSSLHPLGPRKDLEASLETALTVLSRGDDEGGEERLRRALAVLLPPELLAAVAPPAGTGPPGPAHVYVAPSGVFARLPWPTLLERALGASGLPPERIPTVTLVASEEVLQHLKVWTTPVTDGPILALGDPDYGPSPSDRLRTAFFGGSLERLAHSADEVRGIVRPARGDKGLLADLASEAQLRRGLFSPRFPYAVLHLSCHGRLYSDAPWMSALALHATPEDDGLLTVEEVSQWTFLLGPRLVVLAACQSGLGVPVPGEGEEGLVRSFLLAGARNVVASFWRVPDDTSRDLMIAFHRIRREAGASPVVALRRAQAAVRRTSEGKDLPPSAWAGWAVWGPRR